MYLILVELGAAVISFPVSRGDMSSFEKGRRELSIRSKTVRAGGLRIRGSAVCRHAVWAPYGRFS